ncbi:hypothetical protein QZH41_020301, partial [Actinostola sp. cb2023]
MDSDKNKNVCPTISADVSEAEKQMDLKEKLAVIDKEIRQLYSFCVQEGFSPAQIEKCAHPLLAVDKVQKRKKWFKGLALLAVFAAFIACVYLYPPAYNKVCIYSKLASMKSLTPAAYHKNIKTTSSYEWEITYGTELRLLPYWDWRYIYEEDCFMNNPYHVEDTLTQEECVSKCQDLKEVKSFTNTNHKEMSQYLFNQTPVLIKDATENWRARKEFSIEFLAELFQQNQVLRDAQVCQFHSTLSEYEHPEQFLADAMEGKIQGNYQTYWENCDKEAAKELRKFYRRPYFLPPMVEAAEGNWMIISSGGSKSLKVIIVCTYLSASPSV